MTPTERHGQGYFSAKSTVQRGRNDHTKVISWGSLNEERKPIVGKAIFKLLVLTQNVELKPQHPVRAQKHWPRNILKYWLIYLTQNWPYWIYFFLNKVYFLFVWGRHQRVRGHHKRGLFSPTTWVLGMELRLPGLAGNAFPAEPPRQTWRTLLKRLLPALHRKEVTAIPPLCSCWRHRFWKSVLNGELNCNS